MEREKSWEQITEMGKRIGKRWEILAKKFDLPIEIGGISALVNFHIPVDNWLKYKTLITQEMQKNNYLASNSIYVCTEHENEIIDEYFELIELIFNTISKYENGKNIDDLLDGFVCHSGFKRLN